MKTFLKTQCHLSISFYFQDLNIGICDEHKDLYDTNGKYLQSACLIIEQLLYSEAEAHCQANGMELFDVTSEEVRNALFNYAYVKFSRGAHSVLHVKDTSVGSCSFMSNASGPFIITSKQCTKKVYSYCQYKNPTAATNLIGKKF